MTEETIVAGLNAVTAALRYEAHNVAGLWIDKDLIKRNPRLRALYEQAQIQAIAVYSAKRDELKRLSADTRHQGVIAKLKNAASVYREQDLDKLLGATAAPLVLVLDGVQDPHNLGACMRTAAAAGVDAVVAPSARAVGLTPTVRKVASGAAERMPFVQVSNLARTLRALQKQGLWLVGASNDKVKATSLYAADLKGPLAIVLGAEDKGLRRLTGELCDVIVTIPMSTTAIGQAVDSLNVSVAAGIFLFEAQRQRMLADKPL